MTVVLALASSVLWGVADFLGGKTSRDRPVLLIVLVSQTAGLVVAIAVAAVTSSFSSPTGYVLWAVGAGVAGASAVVLFYQALSIGVMGIVAPIAALGVIVPVVIGIFSGAVPSFLSLAGIVIALAGVVLTAGLNSGGAHRGGPASILLAAAAAVGFGLLQYAISGGSHYSTVMTMVVMRATSVPILATTAMVSHKSTRAGPQRGAAGSLLRSPATLLVVITLGVFDVTANLLFALATVSGALAIVAVLGSLYPAATVVLARVIDHERLSRQQNIGVLTAIAGVAMIAAGS